ncbi:MAG: DapH/DapD/GlmU-related protein [Flavobacteriales bacterium]
MRITLLGLSNNSGALILESIRSRHPTASVTVIENVPRTSDAPFLPPGLDVSFVQAEGLEHPPEGIMMIGALKPAAKRGIWEFFQRKWDLDVGSLGCIIHPHSTIAATASIGNGVYIEPGCVISPFAALGTMVTVNRGVTIGHHSRIGDRTMINPGCHVAGHVSVGEDVQLGMGALVFDHVRIGDGAVVGGGSVVTRDVPAGVLAYGNPCRVIKELER